MPATAAAADKMVMTAVVALLPRLALAGSAGGCAQWQG
jgi:hypothetical protein